MNRMWKVLLLLQAAWCFWYTSRMLLSPHEEVSDHFSPGAKKVKFGKADDTNLTQRRDARAKQLLEMGRKSPILQLDPSFTSIKLVIPGHGQPSRTATMISSIEKFRLNVPTSIEFTCEIYVWSQLTEKAKLDASGCVVFYVKGLWTHFMKAVDPSSASYIAIMMDDVILENLDLQTYISSMEKHKLHVLSASVLPSWNWKSMQRNSSCLLRETNYADILFAVFTREAFVCWQDLIDVNLNPHGWGYDVSFPTLCKASVGVSDQHSVVHSTGVPGEAGKERSYSDAAAKDSMWSWLRQSLKWHIPTDREGYRLLALNNNAPAKSCVPRAGFYLTDADYLRGVSHRGGWRVIMEHAIAAEAVTLNYQKPQFQFIDCVESFFLWNNRVMQEPWVGIIHYTPDLPSTFPQFETLQGVLASTSLRKSLSWCKALIVFSHRNADYLRRQLPGIHVVNMKHPIGITGTPRSFDLASFEKRRSSWKVAMLGQQYRRLSTLILIKVKYPKVWLPGGTTLTKASFAERYIRDAHAPKKYDLNSFEIMYTTSFEAYDDFVLHNIIILDVFDAAANNAVLEAIAMANPIFVRRHEAIEEYLGSSYPLFFDALEEAERIINSDRDILGYMMAAHTYLKELPRHHFTLDSFATTLKATANDLYDADGREAQAMSFCAQEHRHPTTCDTLLSGHVAKGCPTDSSDCSIKEASQCAALCKQHAGCVSFAITKNRGCKLCKQSTRVTIFSTTSTYYRMACLLDDGREVT
eukprot:TRINITY_DN7289_c0_g2_i1.p1 TRINITY_DN7289_c0_g2~~TRINITY_DN7289_c0_g2_i1.p1  ORF type:complete len:753 (+),score=99.07 TRINITY_DN7289_c0_g2_i1:81-2339(+)